MLEFTETKASITISGLEICAKLHCLQMIAILGQISTEIGSYSMRLKLDFSESHHKAKGQSKNQLLKLGFVCWSVCSTAQCPECHVVQQQRELP